MKDVPEVEITVDDDDSVDELDRDVEYWLVEDGTVEDGMLLNNDHEEEAKSDENEDVCVVEGLKALELCPVEELELVKLCIDEDICPEVVVVANTELLVDDTAAEDDNWTEVVVLANPESVLDDVALEEVKDDRLALELENGAWPELIAPVDDKLVPDGPFIDGSEGDGLVDKVKLEEKVDIDEIVKLEDSIDS